MAEEETGQLAGQVVYQDLISTAQALRRLGVSPRTWTRLLTKYQIRPAAWKKGPGGQKYWQPADVARLEALLGERATGAPVAGLVEAVGADQTAVADSARRAAEAEGRVLALEAEVRMLHQELGALGYEVGRLRRRRWWQFWRPVSPLVLGHRHATRQLTDALPAGPPPPTDATRSAESTGK